MAWDTTETDGFKVVLCMKAPTSMGLKLNCLVAIAPADTINPYIVAGFNFTTDSKVMFRVVKPTAISSANRIHVPKVRANLLSHLYSVAGVITPTVELHGIT